jgi:hypothetical protein
MMRRVLAILVGLVVFVAVVAGAEFVGEKLIPLPPGFDPSDRNAARALAPTLPLGAWLMVAAGWLLASLAAGFVAARIARKQSVAIGLGVVGTAFAVANNLQVPPPPWFWVVTVLVFVPPAWLAGRFAVR